MQDIKNAINGRYGNKYNNEHNKHPIKIYKKCKQNTYKKYEHNGVY